MKPQPTTRNRILEMGRAGTVGALCACIAMPQLFAEAPGSGDKLPSAPTQTTPLTKDQKTLHALNRLTFGPRPGEEQAVTKEGVDAWFEQQLNPASIDDSDFEKHLAQFPALKLSPEQLMQRYPSPQMIRQTAKRESPLPTDPLEHAIYANAIAEYEARTANGGADGVKKPVPAASVQQAAVAPTDASAMTSTMTGTPNSTPAKGKGKAAFKADIDPMDHGKVQAVLDLPADQRMATILAMSPEQMASFRKGLRPFEMVSLMSGLSPQQREDLEALNGTERLVGAEALESRLERDVYSNRELQAVMVDFWLNHFSVYAIL